MTNNEVIKRLVPYYEEVLNTSESIKNILKGAKDAGLDHVTLAKVAKAKALDKLDDLKEKTEALQNLLEEVSS